MPSFQALFLAYCFLKINGFNIFETGYLKLEWWFSILFIILFNVYYVLFYFIQVFFFLRKNTQASINEVVFGNAAKVWLFTQGKELVKIEENNIAYFFRAGELCLAYTFDGEQYIVDKTLDEIIVEVDGK